LDEPLVWVRFLHFAATVSISGVVIFQACVGGPALRVAANEPMAGVVAGRLARLAWCSLALCVLTAAAWLLVLTAQMTERPLDALWFDDGLRTVLFDTDFGHVWLARSALMALLAVALVPSYFTGAPSWRRGVALVSALALVGALGFIGHAAAGSGVVSLVQQGADVLHLLAAAAWLGALVPLAVLLGAAADGRGESALAIAAAATLAFSTLGMFGVATLIATGIVNTWELAGSVSALFGTDYGRLLLAKIALFLLMLSLAAVNRLRLTPRLVSDIADAQRHDALRRLRNNSLIEAALGALILLIVGMLGTLPPGSEATSADYIAPQLGKS